MKAAEAELNDIENRKKDAQSVKAKEAQPSNRQLLATSNESLSAIELQIEEETKNLLAIRSKLSKVKAGGRITETKSRSKADKSGADSNGDMDVAGIAYIAMHFVVGILFMQ
jgi:hypothetical protein